MSQDRETTGRDSSRAPETTAFEDAVGREYVAEGTPDDGVDGVTPRWVVHPGSVREVAVVMEVAHRHGLSILTRGRGRHLTIGNPPERADAIVSLERVDRILSHEPADMTVRVQAGCTLTTLDATLVEHGQWLPLDPPFAPHTTIGGLLAANLSGPLRASQGTVRDLLIGIRTVGHDGTIVAAGGRVVKNVAGYDLPKMHVGALGTLGTIVDATFKIRPRPPHEAALEISCDDARHAARLALALRDAAEPLWLQVANDGGPPNAWRILAGAGGRPEDVATALERYRVIAEEDGALTRPVPDAPPLRRALADAWAPRDEVVLRAATVPTQVGHWLDSMESASARIGAFPRFHADVTSGVLRASIGLDSIGSLDELVAEVRPEIERTGGSLVVERATAAVKEQLARVGDVWGDPGPGLPLMRELKQAFDPAARLAPGRYVGGL